MGHYDEQYEADYAAKAETKRAAENQKRTKQVGQFRKAMIVNTDPRKSTTYCGCDEGANHMCQRHREEFFTDMTTVQETERPTNPKKNIENIVNDLAPFQIKDSGVRKEFASGSLRDTTEGKVNYGKLLDGPMLERWAVHLTNGAKKYPDVSPGVANWTLINSPEELARYKESAFRHFMQWYRGDTDEDHASAVFFNINGVEYLKGRLK